MDFNKEKNEIILDRELSELDKFVLDFVSCLDSYVVVSGYVSILFGRSRATEDVDLLIPEMTKEEFSKTWKIIYDNGFWCINTPDFDEAFQMLKEYAIRFAKKEAVPNMEFKMIKNEISQYSFNNKIKVIIDEKDLFISPLEMQIAYKLSICSERGDKDVEDARHLYKLFYDNLNKETLSLLINKFKVGDKLELIK
jgi:hypothetical protein